MMSKLIFSKIININSKKYKVKQIEFKSSTNCTLYYNKLVKDYAEEKPEKDMSYDLDDWTSNTFIHHNKPLNISRFGNTIQLIESKQILDLETLKNDLSKIYNEIKTLKY